MLASLTPAAAAWLRRVCAVVQFRRGCQLLRLLRLPLLRLRHRRQRRRRRRRVALLSEVGGERRPRKLDVGRLGKHVRRGAEDNGQVLHERLERAAEHHVLLLEAPVGLRARRELPLQLLGLGLLLLLQLLHHPLAPLPDRVHGDCRLPLDLVAHHLDYLGANLLLELVQAAAAPRRAVAAGRVRGGRLARTARPGRPWGVRPAADVVVEARRRLHVDLRC
mmetsp:Transcript_83563/g.237091  ORF Transcript_83563/g.237091 Transcript_83563/m.237091 type:complete len:221 (+) Transcript_83563:612-1274(+)